MKIVGTKLRINRNYPHNTINTRHTNASADTNASTDAYEEKPSRRDRLLGTAILIAGFALFVWITAALCRPLLALVSNPEKMADFMEGQGAWGRVSFLGIQILQGFLPIPLELTAVAGGYAFGQVQGLVITLCAVMISTTAIFYFTKVFGRKLLNLFFSPAQQKKVLFFREEKNRDALTLVLFLIPGTPKRLFVFSAGLFPQNFGQFLLISTAARIPALLACSSGGNALGSGNYGQAIVIFVVLAAVSLAGSLLYKKITKK